MSDLWITIIFLTGVGWLIWKLLKIEAKEDKHFDGKYKRRTIRANGKKPIDRTKMVENERKRTDDNRGLGGK